MKKILVIGIGAGNPEHVTVQAIDAMNRADVFFVMDKGPATTDLVRIREEICARFIRKPGYRIVKAPSPERERPAAGYQAGVHAWHDEKARLYEALIADEVAEGGCGAFLVWGDPSLYDSTLRILAEVLARGAVRFDHEVIPGITSPQALAAAYRIPLNQVGESILVTTGRKLAGGFPDGAGSVIVMLDDGTALRNVTDDLDVWWGAYLGTPDEVLVAGRLAEVADRIEHTRAALRATKGWIMDTYLLRRRGPA